MTNWPSSSRYDCTLTFVFILAISEMAYIANPIIAREAPNTLFVVIGCVLNMTNEQAIIRNLAEQLRT